MATGNRVNTCGKNQKGAGLRPSCHSFDAVFDGKTPYNIVINGVDLDVAIDQAIENDVKCGKALP